MQAIEIYQYYISLKMHYFQKKYDAWKYMFSTHISRESFEKRFDKSHFYMLSKKEYLRKKENLVDFFSFVFSEKGCVCANEMLECDSIYFSKISMFGAYSSNFKQQLECLSELNPDKVSYIKHMIYGKPFLFNLFITEDVDIETLAMINLLFDNKMCDEWDLIPDTLLQKKNLFIRKYSVYMKHKVDVEKCKNIFSSWLESQLIFNKI